MTQNKRKNYSNGKLMDTPITFYVSKQMFKVIRKKDNMSNYLRELIKENLNIDEHGNKYFDRTTKY